MAYHDAFKMVSDRSTFGVNTFHNGEKGAAGVLSRYLKLSERLNIKLHNEVWELEAHEVVISIEAAQKKAMKRFLKSGAK